eukprot:5577353-Lingulodinium_polyedra.AAC.1
MATERAVWHGRSPTQAKGCILRPGTAQTTMPRHRLLRLRIGPAGFVVGLLCSLPTRALATAAIAINL